MCVHGCGDGQGDPRHRKGGQQMPIIAVAPIVAGMPELPKHLSPGASLIVTLHTAPFLDTIDYHSGTFFKWEYLYRDLPLSIVSRKGPQGKMLSLCSYFRKLRCTDHFQSIAVSFMLRGPWTGWGAGPPSHSCRCCPVPFLVKLEAT